MSTILLPLQLASLRPPTVKEVTFLLFIYFLAYALHYVLVRPLTSPLRRLKHPPGGRGALGHWPDMVNYYNGPQIDEWVEKYGPTFMVRGPYYVHHRLFTMDSRAIEHIMGNPYIYEKPYLLRRVLSRYMSEGLIVAEGHRHKVQRKIVQRLFSRNALRSMGEVVTEHSNQFRDLFLDLLANPDTTHPIVSHHPAPADGRAIDLYSAISRLTYDIIGKIAIDHSFDSLAHPHGPGGELFEKYERMQQMVPGSSGIRHELSVIVPGLDVIAPTENTHRVKAAMGPLEELSRKKIEERGKELAEGKGAHSRDLLSIMLRANMSPDVTKEWKMYDKEISGQLATFVFAGSDTTAGTIAWGLYHLARNQHAQNELRKECLAYGEALPFEQMDELPYLEASVKEMLRTNPSIPNTIRYASRDDIIPLATPIVDQDGKTITEVKIRKGQMIHIPIENVNMAASLWGSTSRHFDPSRWLSDRPNPTTETGPGVWPNIMTFIDGPRRCVGYKLAMMECKILLFTLVRNFVFEPVEGKKLWKWNLFSTRPFVGGELQTHGTSLPLVVRAYKG